MVCRDIWALWEYGNVPNPEAGEAHWKNRLEGMAMRGFRLWVIAGVISAGILMPGCGSKPTETVAEKAAEKMLAQALSDTGQKVDVKIGQESDGLSMTISGDDAEGVSEIKIGQDTQTFSLSMSGADGKVMVVGGEDAKIPDGFPKDVPLYPDMKLLVVQSMPEQEGYIIQARSDDSVDKVVAYLKKEVAAQGWQETLAMSQAGDPPMQMLGYSKDNRVLHFVLNAEDGKTVIHLNHVTE